MKTTSSIDIADVKKIFEFLDIPTEEGDTSEDFYSVPIMVPAWNFGEKPDDSVYSSSTLVF